MNKILIADDNQQITSILANYARKEGFEPLVALDGQQALELFEQHEKNIDVVLLDVMMPKLDGFEVCRELRRRSMVPIIMVTARGEDFERIMGLDIGADDYILFQQARSWRVSALSCAGSSRAKPSSRICTASAIL